MSFLNIAGTDYAVVSDASASEKPREYGGQLKRAFDGTLRNTTRWAKRQRTFTLAPMTQAQLDTLDAVTSLRQIVPVTGTAIGVTINAAVILESAPYVRDGNAGVLRMAVVTIMDQ